MMKDLLVYIPPGQQHPHLVAYAISLASTLQAQLEGMAFTVLPALSGVYATMPDDFYATIEKQGEADAARALQDFVQRARIARAQCSVRSCAATAGDAASIFGRAARCFDLAVVPQTDVGNSAFFNPQFEDTMLLSGRPALFVPTIQRTPASLDRILLCWNGDRWAARAAADALPLMKMSKAVDVLQIELGTRSAPECGAAEIVRHLNRHDIETDLHAFGRDDGDVGNAILSFAADCGSTLIVMGGYGHTRAREMFLGGATREVLKAMTVPVLMSH